MQNEIEKKRSRKQREQMDQLMMIENEGNKMAISPSAATKLRIGGSERKRRPEINK